MRPHVLDARSASVVPARLGNARILHAAEGVCPSLVFVTREDFSKSSAFSGSWPRCNSTTSTRDARRYPKRRPPHLGTASPNESVIPSEVEGSREGTFKVSLRDPSTPLRFAQDDKSGVGV